MIRNLIRYSLNSKKTDFVESDIDGEIFLIIPFNETVRVKSINVIAYDENSAAHQMKAYINNPNVNFDTIQLPSVQVSMLAILGFCYKLQFNRRICLCCEDKCIRECQPTCASSKFKS